MQGKVLKEPRLTAWGHIMFSGNEAEAGVYLFEETSTADIYKIHSTTDGINYVNIYNEHGVAGNDKAAKAGLATYTIQEVTSFPLSIPAEGTATLCLPFNVVVPEGLYAYDATATDIVFNNRLNIYTCNMKTIASPGKTPKSGTPAIIKGNEGEYSLPITMIGREAKSSLPQSMLKGNYVESVLTQSYDTKRFTFTNEDSNHSFMAFDGSKNIAANQCWIEHNLPEADKTAMYFDNSTGIKETPSTSQKKAKKYTTSQEKG